MRPIALALMVILGGCSTIKTVNSFTISQNDVDGAKAAYGTFAAGVVAYRKLPVCVTPATISNLCKDVPTVKKLQAADEVIYDDIASVQKAVTAGDNTGASAAYSLFSTALASGKTLLTQVQ